MIVEGAGVAFGNQTNSPQSRLVRRNIFADNMTWQHGTHRMKFGGEIEFLKGTGTYTLDAPADITLFSPAGGAPAGAAPHRPHAQDLQHASPTFSASP